MATAMLMAVTFWYGNNKSAVLFPQSPKFKPFLSQAPLHSLS
jgi:hypothetical protein